MKGRSGVAFGGRRVPTAAAGDPHPLSRASALLHGTQQLIGPFRNGFRKVLLPLVEVARSVWTARLRVGQGTPPSLKIFLPDAPDLRIPDYRPSEFVGVPRLLPRIRL